MSVPSESTELKVLSSNPIGEAPDKERKVPEEDASSRIMRFGPFYGEDTIEAHRLFKESAWNHILDSTRDGDDRDKTLQGYLFSINKKGKAILDAYDNKMSEKLYGKASQMMMVKDGCCFLQLALHILGAEEQLGYPKNHPYFGKDRDHCKFILDMFFFGNHIPYAVIDALMNQDFFKDVIRRGKWSRPSDGDVVKLALYQTVVEPQLTAEGKKVADARPRDFSIVTALRNVLLRSNTDGDPSDAAVTRRWFRDLEHGHKDNNRVHFPCATELKRSGVTLRKAKGGIANIRFKNRGYSASLYLPPFHIHEDHDHCICRSLTGVVQLEKSLPETEREVTSYVSLIRDLTPTYKDFNILKDQGILIFSKTKKYHFLDLDLRKEESAILCLDKVVPQSESYLTPNLRDILRGIKEYETVPWQRMSFTCSIACGIITFFLAVFTIVQTVFTVLSYYNTINPPT